MLTKSGVARTRWLRLKFKPRPSARPHSPRYAVGTKSGSADRQYLTQTPLMPPNTPSQAQRRDAERAQAAARQQQAVMAEREAQRRAAAEAQAAAIAQVWQLVRASV